MQSGSVVWIPAPGDPTGKRRPAVVVAVSDAFGDALVIFGTKTDRAHLLRVIVDRRSGAARSMGLFETTYFYETNVGAVAMSDLPATRGKTTPGVLIDLQKLLTMAILDFMAEEEASGRVDGGPQG